VMYTDYKCILIPFTYIRGILMGTSIDKSGVVFGKLTVVKPAGYNRHKQKMWLCQCECGKTSTVCGGSLTTGNTKSCGCEGGYFKHGGWLKSSYNTWRAMRRRCNNPKDKDYSKYGGAGVIYQESWDDYLVFEADMGEPEGNKTLHRVNPYGNYTKENCVWASPTQQARAIRVPRNNKTGYTGVRSIKDYYMAQVTTKGKKFYGKKRYSLEDAVADRKELELLHWSGT
jgi:hypothetical protein